MPDYRVPRPADDSAIDFVEIVQDYENALTSAKSDEEMDAIQRGATVGQHHLWVYNKYFFEMEWNGIEFLFINLFELVPDIIESLRYFGFKDEEKLVRDALALFPDGQPAADEEQRQAQVEEAGQDAWEAIQGEWAAIAEASTGEELRRFILDHPDEFFLPPDSNLD